MKKTSLLPLLLSLAISLSGCTSSTQSTVNTESKVLELDSESKKLTEPAPKIDKKESSKNSQAKEPSDKNTQKAPSTAKSEASNSDQGSNSSQTGGYEPQQAQELIKLLEQGKDQKIQQLVKEGLSPNTLIDEEGSTLMHRASIAGNIKTLKTLIENKGDINKENNSGDTPLIFAIINHNQENTLFLIQQDIDLEPQKRVTRKALTLASTSGDHQSVKALLKKGALPDLGFEDKGLRLLPLHMSSMTGNLEVVKALIEHGADVNLRDQKKNIPLHNASEAGEVEIMKVLLFNQAQLESLNIQGATPLHLACNAAMPQAVKLLLEKGADINKPAGNGSTPLSLATIQGDIETVKILLGKKANPNTLSKKGGTPLHISTYQGDLEISKLLLEHGADITIKDNTLHNTPLEVAQTMKNQEMIKLLESYKNTP